MFVPSSSSNPHLLVGRERELGALRERLAAAMAGQGSLVLIGGEAGIGKTALAETICREAHEQGALVLIGRCYDLTETPPYGPWVELFGHYRHSDTGPPLPDAFAQRGTVGTVMSQAALFQQVLDFFTALTAMRPAVLFLDDLHWADPASLDLSRFIGRSVAESAFLVVMTYRSDELTRRHPLYQLLPLLVREATATRLDLRHLGDEAIRLLVQGRYHLPDVETARLVIYLQARAEGNAFFTGELLRALEEAHVLRREDEVWRLGTLTQTAVPPLLRQVIDGRLARLDAEDQRLLAAAAVIGQEVSLDLWAMATETDEDIIAEMVERGTEMRLLAEIPDGARVQFAHALVREAVYESVPAVRRRRIHRRVGETLVGRRHTDPDAVAYHFQHAGDERAYDWLLRAGGRAQDAHAWLTAAARFEAALAMAEERGIEERERAWLLMRLAVMVALATPTRAVRIIEEAARLAERAGDCGLAAYALLQRGTQMLQSSSDSQGLAFVEAGSAALEALTGDERTHLLSDAARYAIPNVVDDGRSSLVFHYGTRGRLAEALHIGESLLQLPEQVTVNLTYNGLAEAYDALGMPERSLAMRDQARAIALAWGHYTNVAYIETRILDLILQYDTDNHAGRHQAMDAAMAAGVLASGTRPAPPRLYGLSLLFLEGQWDEVQRVATSVGTIEEVSGFLLERARLALLRLWPAIGEREATWGLIREWIPEGAAASPDSTYIRAAVHAQQAATQLSLATGDLPMAKEWLEANDRWLAWSGSVLGQSEGQALWAQYYRQEGDVDKAREHAERALAHATEPRQPLALLATHRLLGELDTDARRFDDAQSHLDISLALVDACAAPYERALTLLALANLRAVQHETEAASTLLDEVTTICEPLGAKPTLARAAALRAHLTPTPAPTFPAGLSTREVQVLRLVAQGMTDRQVAELLFLSPRTINQHLRSIYNKLGVSSRAAATHFAVAHGIA